MSEPTAPYFEAEDVGAATVVRIRSHEIRHPSMAVELGEQLRALVDQHGRTRLVIDLSATHYVSSTGFATLLNLARTLDSVGGRMALCRVQPDVLVGARIIGLERLTPIFDDEASAIQAVSG